ncbi:DUF5708 family protein [Streptomyces sp. 6N223]|uniref:DUF5708 family protein n=1 Tax=Streptomyces sp. 6N223 TaxID=3457412 RepID=UPI003FD4F82F
MSRAAKNLTEGSVTLLVGLPLRLFTDGVDTPVVTPTRLGVVLLAIGGVQLLVGLFQLQKAKA